MRNLICITCPKGCHLTVDEVNLTVTGNTCPRGAAYGIAEVTNPVRTITSTVKIRGAAIRRLPVRTDKPISKALMMDVMKLLDEVCVSAPVKRGDVILKNILGTDVSIISSRSLEEE